MELNVASRDEMDLYTAGYEALSSDIKCTYILDKINVLLKIAGG